MATHGLEYLDLDDEAPEESFQKIRRSKKYESDEFDKKVTKKKTKPMHKNRHKVNPDE
jgi:hypothetical protein